MQCANIFLILWITQKTACGKTLVIWRETETIMIYNSITTVLVGEDLLDAHLTSSPWPYLWFAEYA